MIKVVCAIISKEKKLLVTQRSSTMQNPLKWEFPGGKVRPNENHFEAIIRECKEELNLEVSPIRLGNSITHTYPHLKIELTPVYCLVENWEIKLEEHLAYSFVHSHFLNELDLSQADIKLLNANTFTP